MANSLTYLVLGGIKIELATYNHTLCNIKNEKNAALEEQYLHLVTAKSYESNRFIVQDGCV